MCQGGGVGAEVEGRVGLHQEEKATIVSDYIWSRPNTLYVWVCVHILGCAVSKEQKPAMLLPAAMNVLVRIGH